MNSIREAVVISPFGFISKVTSNWLFLTLIFHLLFYFLVIDFWKEIKELLYIYSVKSKAVWHLTI